MLRTETIKELTFPKKALSFTLKRSALWMRLIFYKMYIYMKLLAQSNHWSSFVSKKKCMFCWRLKIVGGAFKIVFFSVKEKVPTD